jgi:hypothetical protein
VFLTTWGSTTFFDFNLEKAHEDTANRVNMTMQLMGGSLSLPKEFTYFVVSVLAGLLSFGTTKLNIRFSYYFYVLSKNSQQLLASKDPSSAEYRAYRKHLFLMYLNILTPVIVVSMYISPLFESLVVPDYLSLNLWNMLRIIVVISAIGVRMLVFREEIQFHLNESYFYVQKLMTDKDEKIFRYIKLRIEENFKATWYAVFQHCSNYIIPILLVLLYINRLVAFIPIEGKSPDFKLDYQKIVDKINAVGVNKFELFGDQESMSAMFSEISTKGLFSFDYQESIFSFLIFWYFFSCCFVYLFSLLYYRKFIGGQ